MLSTGILLIVICAVASDASSPFRGVCRKKVMFKKIGKDHILQKHLMKIHDVPSEFDCAQQCLGTTGCKSYNYQETGSSLHKCELSDQTKSSQPSDYVMKKGFSYHDAEDFELPVCSSSPCQNGGTCSYIDCADSFVCSCKPGYTGKQCETWVGFDGSKSNLPGKSCLTIKSLGEDTGDGRYWIDPNNTGNPFTVYCDMITDGGGWTLIKNLTLLSPSINPYHEIFDYRRVSNLTLYEFIGQSALLKLKKDMRFTQIRYFCRKVSVGRTFHIMTAKNDLGLEVVRYMVANFYFPFPTACNSYVRLPDDNSIISVNCEKWGYSESNTALTGRWGRYPNTEFFRMYTRPVFWYNVRVVSFAPHYYMCDDLSESGQSGDVWKMFVR